MLGKKINVLHPLHGTYDTRSSAPSFVYFAVTAKCFSKGHNEHTFPLQEVSSQHVHTASESVQERINRTYLLKGCTFRVRVEVRQLLDVHIFHSLKQKIFTFM